MSDEIAVAATGLGASFGDVVAVGAVDLRVDAGTVFAVLGPNGAGKTTTVRMLATLLRPDRGHAEVFGYDVVRDAVAVRSMIGLTGQYASVDETLTATENLRLFGRLLGLSRRAAATRAAELLDEFELSAVGGRGVGAFSGGMRRRLDLAATLITDPPLIFLDEPTTGLDPRTRERMWGVIRGLVARGATVLLTTQYLEEADALADRIAVLDGGVVVREGTSSELKSSIGGPVLRVAVTDSSALRRTAELMRDLAGATPRAASAGALVVPVRDPDSGAEVVAACRAAGIGLAGFAVERPDLHEVFLSLTGHPRPGDDAARRGVR